ncbi:MarR family winged helix-turn-helix transcriptional regulator [Jongsikchunia kroppenstedtii]|uniref:MarR family winged helix-turn-helix transcriptional regulator n=1 Tax=Jongsikchunia kroppenstedtii TaxID=1121721 RepID=UPI000361CEAB|nr:MarR family transcriptional regulator [Jongsikchunia kroppenstedtii]
MTSARRLTELVDEVFRLSDAFARAGDTIVADEGLTASRWLTLGAVAHESLSVAAIARRRGMRRQSANESVAHLEAAGLVRREPDPADARAPLVHLTEEGRRTLDRIRPRRLAWATQTSSVVTEGELSTAVDVLRRLRATLEADVPQ